MPSDLPEVDAIATEVPIRPTRRKLQFRPSGCGSTLVVAFVLEGGGTILGYAVSHPWRAGDPPSLGVFADRRDPSSPPETYYVHDVALLPAVRGSGYSHEIVRQLVAEARNAGQTTISLVAIRNSVAIWRRHGFEAIDDPARAEKLKSYGAGATLMVKDLCAPPEGRKVAAPGEGS